MKPTIRARRLLTRMVSAGLAAFLVVVAENFAGTGWYAQMLRWFQPTTPPAPATMPLARSGPVGPPISITPLRPQGNDSSVSAVPQPLILVRTERGRNTHEGFAQIGVRAHSPQTYTAGALLVNGARLTEIHDHYVVLERDGHAARLYLQHEAQPDSRTAQGLLMVGGMSEPAVLRPDSQDSFTTYLRPNPVFAGNELHGFALYPGRNPEPFSQLGLKPGDVLTSIKGSPIANATDSLAALQALMEGEALDIEIEREGVAQSLSLDGSILRRSTTSSVAAAAPAEVTPAAETPAGEAVSSVTLSSVLAQGK